MMPCTLPFFPDKKKTKNGPTASQILNRTLNAVILFPDVLLLFQLQLNCSVFLYKESTLVTSEKAHLSQLN